jgi:hypothetical protein
MEELLNKIELTFNEMQRIMHNDRTPEGRKLRKELGEEILQLVDAHLKRSTKIMHQEDQEFYKFLKLIPKADEIFKKRIIANVQGAQLYGNTAFNRAKININDIRKIHEDMLVHLRNIIGETKAEISTRKRPSQLIKTKKVTRKAPVKRKIVRKKK